MGQALGPRRRGWMLPTGIVSVAVLVCTSLTSVGAPEKANATDAAATAPATASTPARRLPFKNEGAPLVLRKDEGSIFWRLVVSLAAVGALAVAAVLMARRNMLQRLTGGGKGILSVLEASRLGSRATMYLVKAGTKKYLLAASREQVTLLAEVTEAYDDEQPTS